MNSVVKFILCCALSSFCLTACGGDSGSGSDNSGSENSGSENGSSSKQGSDASRDVDVKSSDDPVIKSGVRDSRTGETIETIQIGMYIWMTKNVNNSGWGTSSVCYDDDSENCDTYGKLFESASASTACPTGFDVPLKRDWKWLGSYSAKYPTTVSAMQLNYGGSCSDKSGPLNCKGLGDYGKYLAQDGIAVFTSKSASPAFEEEQMHSYYQLRCMTYTYIVESKNDLPVCDSISKEILGPFYVVNEQTNYRCLGTRWEDDFSESCNHVVKNTAVTINDTLYICKYNSWQVADISDARESCTAANDSTTMLFNGLRYACEDGSWRAFTEIENKLGYCRGNLIGSFDEVKTVVDTLVKRQEYYCDTNGWRRSVMTDHVGFCDSSKVFETVKYMGSSYVCRRNQWESFSSLENEIGVCSPKKNKLISTTESGSSYICDSTSWRRTVLEDYIGVCDSTRIGEIEKHLDNAYLCKGRGWNQLSELENEIGACYEKVVETLAQSKAGVDYICASSGWTRAVVADIGGACDSTKQYKTVKVSGTSYYCKGTSWSTMSSIETQLGFCTEKIQGKIDSIGEGSSAVHYYCESTGWKKMTALEFRLGFCNAKNDSAKKVVHDSVYVCNKSSWKLGTITDMFGVCDSLAAGKTGTFMGAKYGCRKKSWLKMSDFEIENGFCSEKNAGENIKVGSEYYECTVSSTSAYWKKTTDFKYVMGPCPKDTTFRKTYKDTLFVCRYTRWERVTINEEHGYCEPGSPKKTVVFNKQEYICDYGEVDVDWHHMTYMDSLQGVCTRSRVGDTATYKSNRYICDISRDGFAWGYASYKRYMGQCTSAREGHEMFNGFNTSKCTSGKWVPIVNDYMTDSRDGKKYKMVTVKGQNWMVQDLNYATASSDSSWAMNSRSDGRLYSLTLAKKSCPSGWRLPTKTEWEIFHMTFASLYDYGESGMLAGSWSNLNGYTADDFYGVAIYPTGYMEAYVSGGNLVTSQQNGNNGAYFWASDGSLMTFGQFTSYPRMGGEVVGAAVRCVKN